MFTEPTFQPASIFNDGGIIDIGVNSDEKQVIYVQAKANIKSGDLSDYMLHIKECEVERTEEINGVENALSTLPFLIDGCITPGNGFVANTFKIKPNRVQWSDDSQKTMIVEQFSADLWDPEVNMDPDVTAQSYKFKCDLVVCEIKSFERNSPNLHTICKQNQCSRYSNLFLNAGRKRRSTQNGQTDEMEKYGRSDVFQAEGGLKVNIRKDDETEPVTGGAPYYGLALSLVAFVIIF